MLNFRKTGKQRVKPSFNPANICTVCLRTGTGRYDAAGRRALLDYSTAELLIERDPLHISGSKFHFDVIKSFSSGYIIAVGRVRTVPAQALQ